MKKDLSTYFDSSMNSINAKVAAIDMNSNDAITDSRQMIYFIKAELFKLKEFVITYTFENVNEEIDFFKNKKPVILAHLIFFNQVYRIESGCPFFGDAAHSTINFILLVVKKMLTCLPKHFFLKPIQDFRPTLIIKLQLLSQTKCCLIIFLKD